MAEQRTVAELEKEVQALEEEVQREALEKRLARLKRVKSLTLSNGKKAEMRKPTVLDMRLSEEGKTPAEVELILMRNLTGLSQDELDKLDADDYAIYQGLLQGFLS